jgi:hypothetical protein
MHRIQIALIAFILLGCVAGQIVLEIADLPRWEQVTAPPPSFIRLVGYADDTIYALDQLGQLYACNSLDTNSGRGKCVTASTVKQPSQPATCTLDNPRPTPIPPRPVISRRVDHLCWIYPERIDTIITADGSIWQSSQSHGTDAPLSDLMYIGIIRCMYGVLGTLGGVVVYGVALLTSRVIRRLGRGSLVVA